MTFTCGAVERGKIFLPIECVWKWETVIGDPIFFNSKQFPRRRLLGRLGPKKGGAGDSQLGRRTPFVGAWARVQVLRKCRARRSKQQEPSVT